MASLIRSCKSGGNWTSNELEAYRIKVQFRSEAEFFNNLLVDDVDISYLPNDVLTQETSSSDESSYYFLRYLDLAMKIVDNEESAVDDFAVQLLTLMRYRGFNRVIRTRKDIKLFMCGNYTHAKTDVCILNDNEILLLLQENKAHLNDTDPEPQVIAEAIAAFQHNNRIRTIDLQQPSIESITFPCITMIGTYPTFYKVTVTEELSAAVRHGQYPNYTTFVERFDPLIGTRRYSYGMKPLENRKRILKCFEAFRQFMNVSN